MIDPSVLLAIYVTGAVFASLILTLLVPGNASGLELLSVAVFGAALWPIWCVILAFILVVAILEKVGPIR